MAGRGELERAVVEVLWDADGPLTARAVVDGLPGRELAVPPSSPCSPGWRRKVWSAARATVVRTRTEALVIPAEPSAHTT